MQLPKIDVQRDSLAAILMNMKTGALQVPRFQRDFVWPLIKTRALLDSMYKEFPIGTFFLWRAPEGSPPLSRSLDELGIPGPQPGAKVSYILDGQQRLSSLYCAVNGVRFGARDYGRICIDLETAARFDENKDEDFTEDIFVYRTADQRQFVSVQDLAGPNTLGIYDNVPSEWKPAFTKIHNMFQTYPFSVVWIQEQTLADAIIIFQRINQSGKPLSRFDLVCANVWREDFDFRKQVVDVNKEFERRGFGQIEETIFTQTFALIEVDQCTTLAELSLTTEQIKEKWNKVIRSIHLAVDFVVNSLGVKKFDYLPYRGQLAVLAYFYYHRQNSNLTDKDLRLLWDWFWRVTLSERYSATSPMKMAEDAKKLRAFLNGEETSFNYPPAVTTESVLRTKMSSTSSALRNGILCLLALKQPKNFKDNSPVNLGDSFFSNIKQAERHHIFPVGFLRELGMNPNHVHLLPNFCFIPADLNKEIGSRPPADYMQVYKKENPMFRKAIQSHLIPIDPKSNIWKKNSAGFNGFLEERAELLAQELLKLLENGPIYAPSEMIGAEPLTEVDLIEIRIRDFIDERLTASVGDDYWSKAIPSDVVAFTQKHMLSSFPDEAKEHLVNGRRQLDFCHILHYEKIILNNWNVFEEHLQPQDEFKQHMTAFRQLRNAVQHNRKPSPTEQKEGETAILWLNDVLDQYETMLTFQSEENGDTLDDEHEEETTASESRDTRRYDVTAYGVTLSKQAKRNAMLFVIKSLCEHGAEPTMISKLIYWRPNRIFFEVEGECSPGEFVKRATEKGPQIGNKSFDPSHWFCDDGELIIHDGKTYAFSRKWGDRWMEALKILGHHFSDMNFNITKSNKM